LLRWTRELYRRTPEAWLMTSRGVAFELADGQLTPAVAAALEKMLHEVRRRIALHLESWPSDSISGGQGI
jgi:hypothetical protein